MESGKCKRIMCPVTKSLHAIRQSKFLMPNICYKKGSKKFYLLPLCLLYIAIFPDRIFCIKAVTNFQESGINANFHFLLISLILSTNDIG